MAAPEHMMNNLNLGTANKKQYINILLLGETGVGKSTFINAFCNYLRCGTLELARNDFTALIPTRFELLDENYKRQVVQVGADANEHMEVGASATQEAKSYVFPIRQKKKYIRLIDTPGIGDVRGFEQDNTNLENILAFIGELDYLNAICILLKPSQDRMTVQFSFCIKQLLSKLDKSASRNLVFVFTNTRQTFYRPGETFSLLTKMFQEFKGVDIPLSQENTFCTDNEAFRFLVAVKNRVKFSQENFDNFSQSWQHSYRECWRMINYIAGDPVRQIPALEPHLVKNTVSVNQARRLILRLSQPIAEIAQLIEDNIRVLQRHKTQLSDHRMTLDELKNKLYIPCIDLRVANLSQPVTVCTSMRCSTVHQIGEIRKYEYRTKCHNPCYLKNVPKEIVGSPELSKCSVMADGTCQHCKCKYSMHQHIYYETEMFETQQMDFAVKDEIKTKQMAELVVKNIVDKIEKRLRELQSERDIISNSTAKFAVFLQENAIAPYNDAYEEYLAYLIDRERSLGRDADMGQIKNYEKMHNMYKVEKDQLMAAINQPTSGITHITAEEVTRCVERLYGLKHNGQKIMDMFASQSSARKNENKSSVREYVHDDGAAKKKNKKVINKNKNSDNEKNAVRKDDKRQHQREADGGDSDTQVLHITQGSLDIRFVNRGQQGQAQVHLNKGDERRHAGQPQGNRNTYSTTSGGNQGHQSRRYSTPGNLRGAHSRSHSNSSACSEQGGGGRQYQNRNQGRYNNQSYQPRNEPPPDYQETVRQDNQGRRAYQQGGPRPWGQQGGYHHGPNYNHQGSRPDNKTYYNRNMAANFGNPRPPQYANAPRHFGHPNQNFSQPPQYHGPGPYNQPFGQNRQFAPKQQFYPSQQFVPNQHVSEFNPRHRGPYRGKSGPPQSTFGNPAMGGGQQNVASGNFPKHGYESDESRGGRPTYQRQNQNRSGGAPRRFVEYQRNRGKKAAEQPSKVTAFIQSSSDSSSDDESDESAYFSTR